MSLSQQLKAITDKTASVALDRKARSKIHSRSLIFDPKVAAAQDYEYLYDIGAEALEEMIELDSRFTKFRTTLFSEASLTLDRNVQTKDVLATLDKNVAAFLDLVGPYLQLSPAIKTVEWLVRRFHINIHNAELLLLAALPYHNQPLFVKFLNVVPRSSFPSIFEWVTGYKELLKPVPTSSVLKAFHNDFEIFKLYSLYLIEHLRNKTVYKEQLVFYLTLTVQLLASLARRPEALNDTYLPVVLEVVGVMLLPPQRESRYSRTIQADIRMTAYSLVAVLGTVVPISRALVESLSKSILQDPQALVPTAIRHTVVVLGQLWHYYDNTGAEIDITALADAFQNLNAEALLDDPELVPTLVAENYKVARFLTYFFLATYPHPQSAQLFAHVAPVLGETRTLVIRRVIAHAGAADDSRATTVAIIEQLLKNHRDDVLAQLARSGLTLDALEMRLMTTLSGANAAEVAADAAAAEVAREVADGLSDDEDLSTAVHIDLNELSPSSAPTFLTGSAEDEFVRVLHALMAYLAQTATKASNVELFCAHVLADSAAAVSFLIRVGYTPGIPVLVRVASLEHVLRLLKREAETSTILLDVYLLVPVLLVGLADDSRAIRERTVDVLRFVHTQTNEIHAGKKKRTRTVLFMEEAIYGGTDAAQRAVLAPQDAVVMCAALFEDGAVEDTLLDQTRVGRIVFDGLFRAKKKVGAAIETFVMTQWALPQMPVVMKARTWSIANDGGASRRFFAGDLRDYFGRRDEWARQSSAAKVSFGDVERSLVALVGGDNGAQSAAEDADWLLQAMGSPSSLGVVANERMVRVFGSFSAVELRSRIVTRLIELLVGDVAVEFDPMETLQSVPFTLELFLSVVGSVQLSTQVPEQTVVAKRRRRSSSSTKQNMARDDISAMASAHLKKLTVILDVLERWLRSGEEKQSNNSGESSSLVGLLQALFRILTDLDYLGNDGNLPVLYAQETLASCMLMVIVSMKRGPPTKLDSNAVRADLIVNSIRASQSPQVQNRLLLVVAELASLAPETILHSVMPIFTFMGAHTVRQDDEFSSSALQQTIAKVVPALALTGTSSLHNEVEFLLTSFVAAFTHIPRHRRVKLFTSLTKTLGYDTALPALLFLMSQQYVASRSKNKAAECDALAEFSNAFLKTFSAHEQLVGITGFGDLWTQIPSEPIEQGSDEYTRLSARAIFGTDILALSAEGLRNLKAQSIYFLSDVLAKDNANYASVSSMRIKVALVLLDPQASAEERERVLRGFRDFTAFLLAALEGTDREVALSLYALLSNFLALLPLNYFVDAIIDSLDVELLADAVAVRVARNFALLASKKFETDAVANAEDDAAISPAVLARLLRTLITGAQKSTDVELQQTYLDTYAVVVNKFAVTNLFTQPEFSKLMTEGLGVATSSAGLLSDLPEIVIASINVVASIVNILGVRAIGFFPKIVPPALRIWESTRKEVENDTAKETAVLLQTSVLVLLSCLIKKIPAFMATSLDSVLTTILCSDLIENLVRAGILSLVVEHMDSAAVLKSLCNIWAKGFYENDSAANLGLFLSTVEQVVDKLDKKTATAHASLFMKWLMQAFEFRHYSEHAGHKFDNNTIHRLENSFYSSGIAYVMKLNDKSFRPLFASMVRWATAGEGVTLASNTEVSRLLAFFRFFNKMQDRLKSIVTTYYLYLIDPVVSILTRYTTGELTDLNLHRIVFISLTSSFKYDQDDYWSQQTRFDALCDPLLEQLANIEDSIGKYLVKMLSAFIANVSSDEYNEKLVHGLIKYITNEGAGNKSSTKIWTVRTLKTVFQKMGEQWLSYLPTFIPYIAELLEDDNEEVELEVRGGLVRVIESVLGEPLDRYLN